MSVTPAVRPATCSTCGSSIDTLHFDTVQFVDPPAAGGFVQIVEHQLPRQYCGVLEGFQQFAGPTIVGPGTFETRNIEWLLRVNGRPLDPYISFTAILNPWGEAANPFAISLEEGALVEMVARLAQPLPPGTRLGGRLMGRYWFDDPYVRSRPR